MSRLQFKLTAVALVLVGCGEDDPERCDPLAQRGCDDGLVCEYVVEQEHQCFQPYAVEGKVFNLGDKTGIAGARVVAVDVNGAAVSNVVLTDETGKYRLPIPTVRNADGSPIELGTVTLRADASGFTSFPGTVRQPLPVDMTSAIDMAGAQIVKSTLTDIGMLAVEETNAGRIEGKVELPDDSSGIIVVAEVNGVGYSAVAARDGAYAILNLPPGSYTVTAYSMDRNYVAATADVSTKAVTVDLKLSGDAASSVSGQVSIVDGGGAQLTSVVPFIESTYDPLTGRGVTVPGLRAPRSGPPSISGAFTIEGVPAGNYVMVAAFENDGLVRDPDLCIAGTDDIHVQVAAATQVAIQDIFKITGALEIMTPGAMTADSITGAPMFTWVDDSAEDKYLIELFDAYGQLAWSKSIPGTSTTPATFTYDGEPLVSGMYYQWRTTSSATGGGQAATTCNRSRTEDLKGVFFVP